MNRYLGTAMGLAGAATAVALLVTPTAPVQAQNQQAPSMCLTPTDIQSTQVRAPRTIVFRMKDGKVFENQLATPCPDLFAHSGGGWSHTVTADKFCANTQRIEVAGTGMVCRLGNFTRVN